MRNEICVPASAVSLAGEGGESVAPEKGDAVSGTVEGKVSRSEGGKVYVTLETLNGEPLEADPMGAGGMMEPPEMEDSEESLMAEATGKKGGMPYA
jgi:hypothetical protein